MFLKEIEAVLDMSVWGRGCGVWGGGAGWGCGVCCGDVWNGTVDLTTKVNSFDDLNKSRFFLLNRLRI